jgi:hypothetical protein
VLHLHFCWNENNGILPELSEIKLRPLVNAHLADVSLHSLQELSQEEKQLKLILLSQTSYIQHEIIHSTQNNNKGITERIKQL